MAHAVLIIGESGSGKSTSLRNLPPEETFIINVLGKTLPFKGSTKDYVRINKEGVGNYYVSDSHARIDSMIDYVNKKRPDIKYLVLDDWNYALTNDLMRRCLVKGYDKFSEMAHDAWKTINNFSSLRDDLFVFVMMHCETDAHGLINPKTVGKMIDEKVCLEGMFTLVLCTVYIDGNYHFITNKSTNSVAKAPMGMFPTPYIHNDLSIVVEAINKYFNEDVQQ